MTSISRNVVSLDSHRRAKHRKWLRAPFEGTGSARTLNEARERIIALRLRHPRFADFPSAYDYWLARDAYIQEKLAAYDRIIFGELPMKESGDD